MQALMTLASAAALLHSTMVSSTPLATPEAATGPMPQNGVWALLPADCEQPTSLDLSSWAKCATPIGFLDDEVAALERPGPGKKATPDEFYSIARTKFAMAPGLTDAPAPAVAQVVVPMIFSRSYYYLAIAPVGLDPNGRFAEAKGWPVACPPKADGGCTAKTLDTVRTQATIAPTDPSRLYRLVRIQASAPSAPDTAMPDTPTAQPAPTTPAAPTTPPAPPAAPTPAAPALPDKAPG